MKKIAVVTNYFLPVVGGIETSIFEVYSRLNGNDYDVLIHTSRNSYEKRNTLQNKDNIGGLKVLRYNSFYNFFWPNISYSEIDYLILHNFNLFPHVFLVFYVSLQKLIGKKKYKFIVSPHGGMTPNYSNLGKAQGLIKKIITLFTIKLLINGTVDNIRSTSKWETNALINAGVSKKLIQFVPDGIENEAFVSSDDDISIKMRKKVKSFGDYVILLGKIKPTKKYEVAIEAIKRIPSINLLIVGEPIDKNYFELLKRRVNNYGLEDRVNFVKRVSVKEKYYLFRNALSFILTSDWESFGRVCFEAISQGCIVMVSDKTAPSLYIDKEISGFKFNNDNQNELSDLIKKIVSIKKSNKLQKMKNRNKNYAKDYSWKNVTKEFKKLL